MLSARCVHFKWRSQSRVCVHRHICSFALDRLIYFLIFFVCASFILILDYLLWLWCSCGVSKIQPRLIMCVSRILAERARATNLVWCAMPKASRRMHNHSLSNWAFMNVSGRRYMAYVINFRYLQNITALVHPLSFSVGFCPAHANDYIFVMHANNQPFSATPMICRKYLANNLVRAASTVQHNSWVQCSWICSWLPRNTIACLSDGKFAMPFKNAADKTRTE